MVFQSVALSSNRQKVFPPLEMVVQGLLDSGILATRQPVGKGTWQLCEASPLAIPKLQDCSVVAVESERGCACELDKSSLPIPKSMRRQAVRYLQKRLMRDGNTLSSLAAIDMSA